MACTTVGVTGVRVIANLMNGIDVPVCVFVCPLQALGLASPFHGFTPTHTGTVNEASKIYSHHVVRLHWCGACGLQRDSGPAVRRLHLLAGGRLRAVPHGALRHAHMLCSHRQRRGYAVLAVQEIVVWWLANYFYLMWLESTAPGSLTIQTL